MKSLLATLVGATLLSSVPAHAASDLYLNITGIKGESTVKGYEGAIPLLAWSWGLSSTGLPGGGAGKINLQDLNWTQYLDSSFIYLYGALTDNTALSTATLKAVSAGTGGYNFFQAIFSDNLLSSMATGGSGGEDRFTANVSMAMNAVTLRYRPTPTADWVEASFSKTAGGTGAVFSGNPLAMQGLSLALASPVPEPASWALMLGGLVLAGAALRRRLPG